MHAIAPMFVDIVDFLKTITTFCRISLRFENGIHKDATTAPENDGGADDDADHYSN